MKRFFNILALVLALSGVVFSQSAWEWVNPKPQGFDINDVAFLNTTNAVAVGDEGVVIRTSNSGLNWEVSYLPVGAYNDLRSVKFRNSNLGAIVGERGIFYLTTDGGITWQLKDVGVTNYLRALAFLNDTTIVVVGGSGDSTTSAQVARTTDLGLTWVHWNSNVSLYTVAFSSPQSGIAMGYNGSAAYTTDGGATWTFTNQSVNGSRTIRNIYFSTSERGWAVGSDYTGYPYHHHPIVLRTISGYWASVDIGIDSVVLVDVWFISDNEGYILVADGSLIHTTNDGFTWTRESVTAYQPEAIAFTSSGTGILVGQDGIILTSNNDGASWVTRSANVLEPSEDFQDICFSDQYHAWAVANHDLASSSNQGDSWVAESLPAGYFFSNVDFGDADHGVLIGRSENNQDTFKTLLSVTSNAGASWQYVEMDTGLLITELSDIDLTTNSVGYALGSRYRFRWWPVAISGIYQDFVLKTTDGGFTWAFTLIDSLTRFRDISCSGQFALAYTDTSLFTTSNAGGSWARQYFSGLGTQYRIVQCQALEGGVAYMIVSAGGIRYFLKSSNYGVNWESVGLLSYGGGIMYFHDPDFGMICGRGYISVTSNGGSTWLEQTVTPSFWFEEVAFADKNVGLVISGDASILKTKTGGITGVSNGSGLPLQFVLQQNYPNPFNPVTTISYSLPQTDWVTIRVYNLLGSEVATLVDEKKSPGSYQVSWDADGFSSGVYFYKISTGTDVSVKKMVLLK